MSARVFRQVALGALLVCASVQARAGFFSVTGKITPQELSGPGCAALRVPDGGYAAEIAWEESEDGVVRGVMALRNGLPVRFSGRAGTALNFDRALLEPSAGRGHVLELQRSDRKVQVVVREAEPSGTNPRACHWPRAVLEADVRQTSHRAQSTLERLEDLVQLRLEERVAMGKDVAGVRQIQTLYQQSQALYRDRRFAEALEKLQQRRELIERLMGPESLVAADNLRTMIRMAGSLNQHDKVLGWSRELVALVAKVYPEGHPRSVDPARDLAMVLAMQRQFDEAARTLQKARLSLERLGQGQSMRYAQMISMLAQIHVQRSAFGEALALQQRALEIAEAIPDADPVQVAALADALGRLYGRLGDYRRAVVLLERAVQLTDGPDESASRAVAQHLQNLALMMSRMGRREQAQTQYERALAIGLRLNPDGSEQVAVALGNMSENLRAMDRPRDALPYALRALKLREQLYGENDAANSGSLQVLAILKSVLGEQDEAVALGLRAFRTASMDRGSMAFFDACRLMQDLMRRGKQAELSIFFGKMAVNSLQKIRAEAFEGIGEGLNQRFLASNAYVYRKLAADLVATGRLAEAEQVQAMLKHRELFEMIQRNGRGDNSVAMVGREGLVQQQLDTLTAENLADSQTLAALERMPRRELSDAQAEQLKTLRARQSTWQAGLQSWYRGLQSALSVDTSAAQALRDQASRVTSAMRTVVADTPGRAVGLQYIVTDEGLAVLFHTGQASFSRRVPITAVALRQQVARLRTVLDNPRLDPRPAAQALYASLIGPVAAELAQAAPEILILNLDDALRYVPFAALHDGRQYLAERMATAVYTSASGVRVQNLPGARWRIAGLGLTEARPGFSALPSVRQELGSIVRTDGNAQGLVPGMIALDKGFNEEAFRDALRERYPVLHVATHFNFQPGSEQGSFLLLGSGDRLTLADLKELQFSGVDLLTLSACDTAKGGGRTDSGAEVEGLAAIAQLRGAQSVLASLWPVADQSTALLMREFYRLRTGEQSLGGARALQQAQLALLGGRISAGQEQPLRSARSQAASAGAEPAFAPDPARPYAHPFYWAPFILTGNWL